mgnify:CR=1 FL=1
MHYKYNKSTSNDEEEECNVFDNRNTKIQTLLVFPPKQSIFNSNGLKSSVSLSPSWNFLF